MVEVHRQYRLTEEGIPEQFQFLIMCSLGSVARFPLFLMLDKGPDLQPYVKSTRALSSY